MLAVAPEETAPRGEEASQATILPRQQLASRTFSHRVVTSEVWFPNLKQVSPPPLPGRPQPFDVETEDLYGLLDSGDLIFRFADTVVSFNSTIVSDRQ